MVELIKQQIALKIQHEALNPFALKQKIETKLKAKAIFQPSWLPLM